MSCCCCPAARQQALGGLLGLILALLVEVSLFIIQTGRVDAAKAAGERAEQRRLWSGAGSARKQKARPR